MGEGKLDTDSLTFPIFKYKSLKLYQHRNNTEQWDKNIKFRNRPKINVVCMCKYIHRHKNLEYKKIFN